MKILHAEDEQDLRELVNEFLTSEGFDVESVENGLIALNKIKSSTEYGMLITDIMMPHMSGLDLVTAMRESEVNYIYKLPVMVYSASTQLFKDISAIKGDKVFFVAKPFDMEIFLATVRMILNKELL